MDYKVITNLTAEARELFPHGAAPQISCAQYLQTLAKLLNSDPQSAIHAKAEVLEGESVTIMVGLKVPHEFWFEEGVQKKWRVSALLTSGGRVEGEVQSRYIHSGKRKDNQGVFKTVERRPGSFLLIPSDLVIEILKDAQDWLSPSGCERLGNGIAKTLTKDDQITSEERTYFAKVAHGFFPPVTAGLAQLEECLGTMQAVLDRHHVGEVKIGVDHNHAYDWPYVRLADPKKAKNNDVTERTWFIESPEKGNGTYDVEIHEKFKQGRGSASTLVWLEKLDVQSIQDQMLTYLEKLLPPEQWAKVEMELYELMDTAPQSTSAASRPALDGLS